MNNLENNFENKHESQYLYRRFKPGDMVKWFGWDGSPDETNHYLVLHLKYDEETWYGKKVGTWYVSIYDLTNCRKTEWQGKSSDFQHLKVIQSIDE